MRVVETNFATVAALILRIGVVVVVMASLALTAFAHELSISYSHVKTTGPVVEVLFTVNLHDIHAEDVQQAVEANYAVEAPQPPVSIAVRQAEIIAENVMLLDLVYSFENPVETVKITSTLDRVTQSDHSHIVQIGEGDDSRQAVLNVENPSVQVTLGRKACFATVWDFLKLGVEHIFTGYDHLAFVAGLLVMTTTLRSLLKVITAFTAGHSITLALATFGLVSVPSRFIESLIALSIAYIAAENFMGKTLVHRWKITFLFGLVHGFGFSNVLQEMALSRSSLAISLFSFNGGVELGQLAFVALFFPIVYCVTSSRWRDRFIMTCSVFMASLGLFWFIQRAL